MVTSSQRTAEAGTLPWSLQVTSAQNPSAPSPRPLNLEDRSRLLSSFSTTAQVKSVSPCQGSCWVPPCLSLAFMVSITLSSRLPAASYHLLTHLFSLLWMQELSMLLFALLGSAACRVGASGPLSPILQGRGLAVLGGA